MPTTTLDLQSSCSVTSCHVLHRIFALRCTILCGCGMAEPQLVNVHIVSCLLWNAQNRKKRKKLFFQNCLPFEKTIPYMSVIWLWIYSLFLEIKWKVSQKVVWRLKVLVIFHKQSKQYTWQIDECAWKKRII